MTIPGERAECCAAEGAYAENSQAKGLDSDDTLESNDAPKKQPAAAGNLSGKATEAQKR